MIIVRAPRTRSGRRASEIRLRSSGGETRDQSVLGTTPNIEPPSSRKRPSLSEISSRSPRTKRLIFDVEADAEATGDPCAADLAPIEAACFNSTSTPWALDG